jgi:hypothetical protein
LPSANVSKPSLASSLAAGTSSVGSAAEADALAKGGAAEEEAEAVGVAGAGGRLRWARVATTAKPTSTTTSAPSATGLDGCIAERRTTIFAALATRGQK